MMQLLHRWIWDDAERRARKLFNFAETEADGGRELVRAAESTRDVTLRRLYTIHAADEARHAAMFRTRGAALLRSLPIRSSAVRQFNWFSPGERGFDDLHIEQKSDAELLAFLHLSEKAAAGRFAIYRDALGKDPGTKAVFQEILRDETFHMNYTLAQIGRIAPRRHPILLWRARFGRLWKAYLRVMAAIANVMGTIVFSVQYFVLLPPFAFLAKRAERNEPEGWCTVRPDRCRDLKSQY